MADISSELKRGFLRSIWRAANKAGVKLLAALEGFQSTKYESVKAGRIVIQDSSNGHSVTFSIPSIGSQLTSEQVFSLAEELIETYELVVIQMAAATPPVTGAADSIIFDAIMGADNLNQTREQFGNYLALRAGGVQA